MSGQSEDQQVLENRKILFYGCNNTCEYKGNVEICATNGFSMNSSKSFNFDRLFGISAFFISIATFIVYIYEANLIRTQQYASVLPYLEMWNSRPADGTYKLILVNNGVGPAFVKEIRVHYQGKSYEGDHVAFHYQQIYPKDTTFTFMSSNIRPGQIIPAGRQIELIVVENNTGSGKKAYEMYGKEKARLEIVYTSIYEEKWKLTGMEDPPRKLD